MKDYTDKVLGLVGTRRLQADDAQGDVAAVRGHREDYAEFRSAVKGLIKEGGSTWPRTRR